MLCVEFPQVQYIDVSETLRVLKSCCHCVFLRLKIINDFCGQSPFQCYKMSVFWTQKDCPFPLNRGVPSIEVKNTKIMGTFSGTKFYVL